MKLKLASDSPCRFGLHNYQLGVCLDCGEPEILKTMRLAVTIRLPASATEHRVAYTIGWAVSKELRGLYGDVVDVTVSKHTGSTP